MSNLYELTGDVLELQEMLENDPENQAIQDTLEALTGELELKATAYCKVIKNMEGNLESFKNEIDRLNKKKKNIEHSISRLKQALFNAMQVTGTDKIKGELFTLRIQNNAPKLPSDLDINMVPIDYLIEREYEIDKRKLLAAIKNGEVDGIELEVNQSLRIS